jgi:type IV pilus assembly protein PilQ
MKNPTVFLTIMALLAPMGITPAKAAQQIATLGSRVYSVNVSGASAEGVIRMIAQKAGVPVQIEGDLSKRVSYNFTDTTLENALARMANDVGFEYSMRDNTLFVSKGGKSTNASAGAHLVELKFVEAEEMANRLTGIVGEGETIYPDKKNNTLVLMGSEATYQRVTKFIELFDRMPKQILIETMIVETNDTFSRDLGFQLGDIGDTSMNNQSKGTAYSTPAVTTTPYFGGKYRFGVLNNRALDLRLIAAESKGDAKVVSRPKVVTINNTRATVNSGLEFNVKTLSSAVAAPTTGGTGGAGGTGSTSGVLTGGLEKVEAGLELGVLPTIVDNNKVRLLVDVNNSEPDNTASVDNIPGISRNKANTSLIVLDGDTAVIAGLIKQRRSNTRTGIPFLSSIPVLGMLFRNDSRSDRNNELMIFVTPRILDKVENSQAQAETQIPKVD